LIHLNELLSEPTCLSDESQNVTDCQTNDDEHTARASNNRLVSKAFPCTGKEFETFGGDS
jgi:hypothetical protein